jgi:hypothetical protein
MIRRQIIRINHLMLRIATTTLPLLLMAGGISFCTEKQMDLYMLPDKGTKPNVLASYPKDGDLGIGNPELWVLFDHAMDQQKTQSSFRLSSGSGNVYGNFRWEGTKMFFKPSAPIKNPEQYTMLVERSAESSSGIDLSEDYIVRFYPVGDISRPRFISSTPTQGASGVAPATNIVLRFSKAIDYSTIVSGVSISPAFTYTITQNAALNEVIFTPSSNLQNGTYTIRMNQNLKDTTGNSLYQEAIVSFTVGSDLFSPAVLSVRSGALTLTEGIYTTGADKSSSLSIQFSEPMNRVETENAITLNPSALYLRSWNAAGDLLTLTFSPQLNSQTYYMVNIGVQAADASGNLLARSYSYGFITNAPASVAPVVMNVYQSTSSSPGIVCADNAFASGLSIPYDLTVYGVLDFSHQIDLNPLIGTNCALDLMVRFNNSMDINSFLPPNTAFTGVINPVANFTIYDIRPGTNPTDIHIILTSDFVANGGSTPIYKLFFRGGATGIKDINGNTMSQDFEYLFMY